MKLLYPLLIIGLSYGAAYLQPLFDSVGVQEFADIIESTQQKKVISPTNLFLGRRILTDAEKEFFKTLDVVIYKKGITDSLQQNFTSEEMTMITKFFQRPFNAKMLGLLISKANLNVLLNKILSEDNLYFDVEYPHQEESKKLYDLLDYKSIVEVLEKETINEYARLKKLSTILENANRREFTMRLRAKQEQTETIKEICEKFIYQQLAMLRKSEVAQFIAMLSGDEESYKKFAHLLISYQFFYEYKHKQEFKRKKIKK